jgi:hypothetical protein
MPGEAAQMSLAETLMTIDLLTYRILVHSATNRDSQRQEAIHLAQPLLKEMVKLLRTPGSKINHRHINT